MKGLFLFLVCLLTSFQLFSQSCGGTTTISNATGVDGKVKFTVTHTAPSAMSTFRLRIDITDPNVDVDDVVVSSGLEKPNPLSTGLNPKVVQIETGIGTIGTTATIEIFLVGLDPGDIFTVDLRSLNIFASGTPCVDNTVYLTQNLTVPTGNLTGSASLYKPSGSIAIKDMDITASTITFSNSGVSAPVSGAYSIPLIPGTTYTVSATRDGDDACSITDLPAPSVSDFTIVQKHILATDPFTDGWQFVAADANDSKTVSTIDLIKIRNVALGFDPNAFTNSFVCMPSANVSQITIPATPGGTFSYDETESKIIGTGNNGLSFSAIKVGDVDATCTGSPITGLEVNNGREIVSNHKIQMGKVHNLQEAEEVWVPIYISNFKNVQNLALSLYFNQMLVEVLDLKSKVLPNFNEEVFRINKAREGSIDLLWFIMQVEGVTVDGNDPILYVKLRAKKDIKNSDRILFFRKGGNYNSVARKNTRNERITMVETNAVETGFGNDITGGRSDFEGLPQEPSLKISPNPFKSELNISLNIIKDDDIILNIFDMTGRLIYNAEREVVRGNNQILLNEMADWPSGPIFYQIILSDSKVLSGKLIKE